ncbi:MAG TPA: sugar-binding domain-containing protein, partial [Bacteroidales bacterium]
MRIFIITALLLLFWGSISSPYIIGQETQRQYLSGTGSDHTVNWQFFCTEGRNSGYWTTIPVPSNWELQGFGTYNYGLDKDTLQGREKGLYKYEFSVPTNWKDKNISLVFEGSMTDTEAKINGKSAGIKHQGAFYCFRYDVTYLIKPGQKNILEVTVAKHSDNKSVNKAERQGDYWIFGGIYRPVYLEAKPKQHIRRVAIDAEANGHFESEVYISRVQTPLEISAQIYSSDGKKFGEP